MGRLNPQFGDLEGIWDQERTITPGARYTGTAIFRRIDETSLHYREDGTTFLAGGCTITGFRSYIYRIEGERISVWFDEKPPRLFHFISQNGQAHHLCGADEYCSEYRFGKNEFAISHRVAGPRKSYTIETLFKRRHASRSEVPALHLSDAHRREPA